MNTRVAIRSVVSTIILIPIGIAAQQLPLKYNFEYSCEKERIVISHCRHDSDMPGTVRTTPEKDYCQVYYPDRPKSGGFEAMGIVLRSDVINTLTACGALHTVQSNRQSSKSEIDDSVAEFKVGDAYFKGKDYARALEHFKRSNAIAVSSVAYLMTGISQYYLKQYPESIESIKETVRMVPDNPGAHYWLGRAYKDLGGSKDIKPYANAEREFKEAIRLKPDYQIAYTWLGSAEFIEQKFPDAARHFNKHSACDRMMDLRRISWDSRTFDWDKRKMPCKRIVSWPSLIRLVPQTF